MALPTTLSVAFMFKMSEKVRKEMKIVQQYYTIKMVDKIIDIGKVKNRICNFIKIHRNMHILIILQSIIILSLIIGRKETRKDDNGAKLNENQEDVFISNI